MIVGGMLARNEGWVVGMSLRVARSWCDAVVVGLHDCADETEEIVDEVNRESGGIHKIVFEESRWDEMRHRHQMLQKAREVGATHFAVVDADEVVTGNLIHQMAGFVSAIPHRGILSLPGYNLRRLNRYHSNGVWGNRWFSVAFKDEAALGWEGDRFHHREPMGASLSPWQPVPQGHGGVMHLWGASERRLKAKHALYKMTEVIRWPAKRRAEIDQMYSMAIRPAASSPHHDSNWMYSSVPESWWEPHLDLMHRLDVDRAPWQEVECQKLFETWGAAHFRGLDLFGVVEF